MKFNKQILREGLYYTGDGKGGRTPTFIDKDRIAHWADQHAAMRAAGIQIPAPELHIKDAKPESETDKKSWSKTESGSKSNYGFWDQITTNQTEDGFSVLTGTLDVPLENDADKVGKTVRETSISVLPEFIDGTGKVWKDVIGHIAVITKPIEPGQPNFEPQENTLSMSHFITMNESMENYADVNPSVSADQNDLCDMLEKVAGVAIPKGIAPDQLERALLAALRQKQLDMDTQDGGSLSEPPKNSNLHQVPVVMTHNQTTQNTDAQAQSQSQAGDVQPNTIEMAQLQSQNRGLIASATSNKRKELATRLGNIRTLISKDQYEKLTNEIGEVEMSFSPEGDEIKSQVELRLEGIELISVPLPKNGPVMAFEGEDGKFQVQSQVLPEGDGRVTEEQAEAIVNSMLGTG